MSIKSVLFVAFSCVFGGTVAVPKSREKLHEWVLKMHRAQIELLKIEWGKPGFAPRRSEPITSKPI